jgi:hypothetical protein
MDFSPSARLAMSAGASPVPAPTDPQMADSGRVLCRAITTTIVRYGMGEMAAPATLPLLQAYAHRALALVVNEIDPTAASDP